MSAIRIYYLFVGYMIYYLFKFYSIDILLLIYGQIIGNKFELRLFLYLVFKVIISSPNFLG